jgi:glucan endo-1,3-alpha-glucosidase
MSADFCCGVGFDDARAMVEQFASHPNQLRYDGRVVLSATDAPADAAGWSNLRAQLQGAGTGVFLVPSIFPFAAPPPNTEVVEQPTPAQAQDLFDRVHGFLDGYFYLGEAGTPGSIALVNQAFAALYAPTPQRFVAAITPSYWGALQASAHHRYFEFGGGAGAEAEWSGLIDTARRAPSTAPPPWVEITTWNDFATDSYIAPTAAPPTASGVPLQTHAGLAELYRYHIAWFKAGAPPAIRSDEVVFAYRTQPFGATATMDTADLRPQAAGGVAASDTLAVTTLLTAPAELRVYTGTGASAQSWTQPAGVSTVQVPFAPGPQRVELWRGGAQLVAADGAPIDAQPAHYNASVYSSFARAP